MLTAVKNMVELYREGGEFYRGAKMKLPMYRILFPALFLCAPLLLYPQVGSKQVALIPFWGDDEAMVKWMGEDLLHGVGSLEGYSPWTVDMTNLPADVPEGGFPPFQCPSPSLTRGSPYAMTGNATPSGDGRSHTLLIYLWKMSENRLIYNDWMTIESRESYQDALPGVLEWFFSWADREPEAVVYIAEGSPAPQDRSAVLYLPNMGDSSPAMQNNTRLWSIGLSIGTGFPRPRFSTSIYGTIAPFRYSFLEIGIDAGFISELREAGHGHYSIYPYAHYAAYLPIPFLKNAAWYIGAGGGYNLATYIFPEGDASEAFFAVDFVTGFVFWDCFTAGYTLRTNFGSVFNHKFSVGILLRFIK
jgi:hypothetical protein